MKISIFAATELELAPLQKQENNALFSQTGHQVQFCTTGVGMLQSSFHIHRHLYNYQPDFLLQIGIAGCFDSKLALGTVVAVQREYLGSLGVNEGHWRDIFDLGLQGESDAPFYQKALINSHIEDWNWLQKAGIITGGSITVDEITTDLARIEDLKQVYAAPAGVQSLPMLESMEGASLHFIGLQYQLPFLQLRGVSNYIGQRDKSKWQIGPALNAVTAAALKVIGQIK